MSSADLELTPGDYAFLGMVGMGAQTAYQVKKLMAGSVSFFWNAAHSQVYQQAARLVRDGYVREREEAGGRRRRILSLTAKGRLALRRWLTTPSEPLQLRDEMLVKVFFAVDAGDYDATARMLENLRATYRGILEEFLAIEQGLSTHEDDRARDQALTVGLGIRVMEAYLSWLGEAANAIRAR
ncbi:MAG TPA: helix-turn-helix transcriptional regulator [Actinomycetota bacterium]